MSLCNTSDHARQAQVFRNAGRVVRGRDIFRYPGQTEAIADNAFHLEWPNGAKFFDGGSHLVCMFASPDYDHHRNVRSHMFLCSSFVSEAFRDRSWCYYGGGLLLWASEGRTRYLVYAKCHALDIATEDWMQLFRRWQNRLDNHAKVFDTRSECKVSGSTSGYTNDAFRHKDEFRLLVESMTFDIRDYFCTTGGEDGMGLHGSWQVDGFAVTDRGVMMPMSFCVTSYLSPTDFVIYHQSAVFISTPLPKDILSKAVLHDLISLD